MKENDAITISVFKDGDCWCAVHTGTFINIQESECGFGDTILEAIDILINESGLNMESIKKSNVSGVKMTNEQKKWIDNESYETLLGKWRNSRSGDPMFQGDTGQYYKKVMCEARDKISDSDRVQASKNVGLEQKD